MNKEIEVERRPQMEDQAADAGRRQEGMGAGTLLMLLAWPTVLAGVLFFAINHRLDVELESRPRVSIVDEVKLVKLAIDNGANRQRPLEVMAKIEDMIKDAGLEDNILLGKSMIMYSPRGLQLDVGPTDNASISKAKQQ